MKWIVRNAGGAQEVEVERAVDGFVVSVDGRRLAVDLIPINGAEASLRFVEDGRSYHVTYHREPGRRWRVAVGVREFEYEVLTPVEAIEAIAAEGARGPSRIVAPIPGKVVAVKVAVGDAVDAGQSVVVLEAMKMENELTAEQPGTVTAVHITPGATVESGALLVELD
jgi:biotin carboxyl carrier protein